MYKNETTKRLRVRKPHWNEDLTNLWKNMVSSEKMYLKCKTTNYQKRDLHIKFKDASRKFDKALRLAEREYRRKLSIILHETKTDDPIKFWEHIKQLGPKCKK